MANKIISVSEDALVSMLKTLPKDVLVNLFWKTLIENDTSALSVSEKRELKEGKIEYKRRRTIAWENIK